MAAYVISPNGQVHKYPQANYAQRRDDHIELYDSDKKRQWIADIPSGWAVGWSRPHTVGGADVALELLGNIREAPGDALARIKLALKKFDARTHGWKD